MASASKTTTAEVAVPKSEDSLGLKWDKCLSDSAIKMGAGFALGGVASLLLFRRRVWPIVFGTGAGFGMAYSNCQNELNKPFQKGCCAKKMAASPEPSKAATEESKKKEEPLAK